MCCFKLFKTFTVLNQYIDQRGRYELSGTRLPCLPIIDVCGSYSVLSSYPVWPVTNYKTCIYLSTYLFIYLCFHNIWYIHLDMYTSYRSLFATVRVLIKHGVSICIVFMNACTKNYLSYPANVRILLLDVFINHDARFLDFWRWIQYGCLPPTWQPGSLLSCSVSLEAVELCFQSGRWIEWGRSSHQRSR